MRVLVTGANGFLGSHLVKALVTDGFEVLAMVREQSDRESLEGINCQIVTGDILDYEGLLALFNNLDGVFHVAGAMSSNPKERERLFSVNVKGVQNIIRACIENKIKKLVHVSSVVAVGTNMNSSDSWLTEESKNITNNLGFANYDSKRMGEELVLAAARSGQLNATVVNPGLIYGEADAKKSIRKGNIKAAQGKLPFYTSGGVNVVAVEDVTSAMIAAFKIGRSGERYLLTGDNISIQQLLSTISELAGAKAPHKLLPMKLAGFLAKVFDYLGLGLEICRENVFSASTFHWYDNTKAKRELAFNPKGHRQAIQSSVDWMKAHHYL